MSFFPADDRTALLLAESQERLAISRDAIASMRDTIALTRDIIDESKELLRKYSEPNGGSDAEENLRDFFPECT